MRELRKQIHFGHECNLLQKDEHELNKKTLPALKISQYPTESDWNFDYEEDN